MALRGAAAVTAIAASALWFSPVARAASGPSPSPSSTTGTQDGVSSPSVVASAPAALSPPIVTAPAGVTVPLSGTGSFVKGACVLGIEVAPGDVRTSQCTLQRNGALDASFTVPWDAAVGAHAIRVCVGDCGNSSVASNAVVGEAAALSTATLIVPPPTLQAAQPALSPPGGVVTVLGSGWSPGGTCTVVLGSVDTGARCAVDAVGRLHASLVVPAAIIAGLTRIVVNNRLPGGLDPVPVSPVQSQSVPFRVVPIAVSGSPTAQAPTAPASRSPASVLAGEANRSGGAALPVTIVLLALALVSLLLLAVRAIRNRRRRPPLPERLTVTVRAGPWLSPQPRRPAAGLRHVLRIQTVGTGTSTTTLERQP